MQGSGEALLAVQGPGDTWIQSNPSSAICAFSTPNLDSAYIIA